MGTTTLCWSYSMNSALQRDILSTINKKESVWATITDITLSMVFTLCVCTNTEEDEFSNNVCLVLWC